MELMRPGVVRDLNYPIARAERGSMLKVAFRRRALRELKGARLSVFLCLALHVDRYGVAKPGILAIMEETGYSRPAVCGALDWLRASGLVEKRPAYRGVDEYTICGYAWFGTRPAPALWEECKGESSDS